MKLIMADQKVILSYALQEIRTGDYSYKSTFLHYWQPGTLCCVISSAASFMEAFKPMVVKGARVIISLTLIWDGSSLTAKDLAKDLCG